MRIPVRTLRLTSRFVRKSLSLRNKSIRIFALGLSGRREKRGVRIGGQCIRNVITLNTKLMKRTVVEGNSRHEHFTSGVVERLHGVTPRRS